MEEQLKELLASIKNAESELRARGQESTEQTAALKQEIVELRSALDDVTVKLNRPGGLPSAANDAELERRTAQIMQFMRVGELGELRTLSGATDAEGAVFLPADMSKEIYTVAAALNEIRPLCSVNRTGRDRVFLPSLSRPKAGYGNVTPTEQELSADSRTLDVFCLKALCVLKNDTLSDAAYDLAQKLIELFSDAKAEEEARVFLVGTGNGEPLGIISPETKANAVTSTEIGLLGATHADAVALIKKGFYKLRKQYRRRAVLLCNSQTEAYLDSLRDADGRKLLTTQGEISYFDGIRIVTAEDMDDIATGKFPIVIGDLKHFEIYDREGLSVKRLTGGNYDTSDTVGFLLKARHAAGVTQPEAFVPVKIK